MLGAFGGHVGTAALAVIGHGACERDTTALHALGRGARGRAVRRPARTTAARAQRPDPSWYRGT